MSAQKTPEQFVMEWLQWAKNRTTLGIVWPGPHIHDAALMIEDWAADGEKVLRDTQEQLKRTVTDYKNLQETYRYETKDSEWIRAECKELNEKLQRIRRICLDIDAMVNQNPAQWWGSLQWVTGQLMTEAKYGSGYEDSDSPKTHKSCFTSTCPICASHFSSPLKKATPPQVISNP